MSRAIKKEPDSLTDCCWERRVYISELQLGNMHQKFTALKSSFPDPLFQGLYPEEIKDVPKEISHIDAY